MLSLEQVSEIEIKRVKDGLPMVMTPFNLDTWSVEVYGIYSIVENDNIIKILVDAYHRGHEVKIK